MAISISSLNVRGLNNANKRNVIYKWVKDNKFDLCFLQETYCLESFKAEFCKHWKGDIFHSCTLSPHSRGVCILVNNKLKYKVISSHSDNTGRIVLLNIEIDDKEYTFVNVYAPNDISNRVSFFQEVSRFITLHSLNNNRLFIAGDFNCVLTGNDRYSGKIDKSTAVLNNMIERFNLVDAWRLFNPGIKEFTYISSCSKRSSRIDFILCSNSVKSLCTSSNICQAPAPDHKAVCLSFKTDANIRGKGYWKFNNSYLKDQEFLTGVRNLFAEIIHEYNRDVTRGLLWDYIKLRIKQYCVTYGIRKSRGKKDVYKELKDSLDQLDKQLAENYNIEVCQERNRVKAKLDEYYQEKSKGYQIRSRAKWIEEGEQSTRYFLRLEKVRQNHNCINALKDGNGNTATNDTDILEVATSFYSNLFRSKNVSESSVNSFFDSITPEKVLSEDLMQTCEGKITKDECYTAITTMKKNKSPGLDGFSIEFYEHFWPLLGDLLVETFNENYDNGILTDSQRCSVLSLIFKKGDTEDIVNYRPISLTNVDYRILAFVLANRLQGVINSIISQDQNAYIKNRYMGYNIRLVEDIIDYYQHLQTSGILFMLDFQKAFDSLEWNFIFKTLDIFDFGPSFKKCIKTIYKLPECKIKNNGHVSQQIDISGGGGGEEGGGVKEGCVVSALLFILYIEILIIKVRQHSELKGFDLGFPNTRVKTIQYADDCVLCFNDKNELCTALSIIRDFGKVSGLILHL